jgi:hypothetical protein
VAGPIARWRAESLAGLGAVDDFVGVLMKRRNGGVWTPEDRVLLRAGLRSAARCAPLLLLFLLPGGLLALPAYAWLLDRRRVARR